MNDKQERKAKRDISLANFFVKVRAFIHELERKYPELRELEGKDSDREL
ncbi:unnamed protein product, partial [marine sediment metagenome]